MQQTKILKWILHVGGQIYDKSTERFPTSSSRANFLAEVQDPNTHTHKSAVYNVLNSGWRCDD